MSGFKSPSSNGVVSVDGMTGVVLLNGTYVGRLGGTSSTVATLPFFNVKDYGAVGNGSTDDTAAIVAAIAAATAVTGGIVFFPPGIYKISSTITVPTQVTLQGVGRRASTLLAAAVFTGTFMVNLGDPAGVTSADLVFHARVQDMALDCNGVASLGGVFTNKANEQSGVFRTEIVSYTTIGIRVETGTVKPDNCSFEDLELYPHATATGSVGLDVNGVVSKVIGRNITVNFVAQTPLQTAGVRMTSCADFLLEGIHVEYCTNGVQLVTCSGGVICEVDARHGTNVVNTDSLVIVIGAWDGAGTTTLTVNDTLRGDSATGFVPLWANILKENLWMFQGSAGTAVLRGFVTGDSVNRVRMQADGKWTWGPGNAVTDLLLQRKSTAVLATDGDFAIDTAGKGLQIKEGSNAKMGTATLSAGVVDVATTAVTATSRIFLTGHGTTTISALTIESVTAGTSFRIRSANASDVRTVDWLLVEPAA